MNKDKKIIADIINTYNLNPDVNYYYTGASIIKKTIYQDYIYILFCEDDLVDENNIPYIMEGTIFSKDYNNDRIIVLYDNNLNRYIIPINGDNWNLIDFDIPKNVKEINISKAKKIFHRKSLNLSNEIKELSKEDINNLKKNYKNKYKKGRLLVAAFFASLLWSIILFLIFIFSFLKIYNIYSSDSVAIILLITGFLIWLVGVVLINIFFINLPIYRLKKLKYKSEFLIVDISSLLSKKGICDSIIKGYVHIDNNYEKMINNSYYYDSPFLENIDYCEIVTRYSKKKSPKENDYCLFCKK